jgi:glycine/D-amino acid oxidase-like deaminating enzyme
VAEATRRGLLAAVGGAAAGSALAPAAAAQAQRPRAPAYVRGLPDVAVVGAGAFGAWTALSLREKGAKVTLLDAFGPGNARQTSGDETRQIRAAYGGDAIYIDWANEAFRLWHERQEEFGRDLIFNNGVLSPNESRRAIEAERPVFDRLKIPYEILSRDELRKRWPQGRYDDVKYALYEPKAGTVKAREAIIAVAEAFRHKGGTVRIGSAKPGAAAGGRLTDIDLGDGERLSAGAFVFACGPWLPKVLPDVLTGYLRLYRSEVFYVGSPPGDDRYTWRKLPNMWENEGVVGAYAISDVDYGYKVVPWLDLGIDPDNDDRVPSAMQLRKVRAYLERRLPGLLNQPIVAARVCALENSNNHHFIIDTHPAYANAWIAGAGSGHAFKMGPKLGDYISDRVIGREDDPESRKLFALATHAPVGPRR